MSVFVCFSFQFLFYEYGRHIIYWTLSLHNVITISLSLVTGDSVLVLPWPNSSQERLNGGRLYFSSCFRRHQSILLRAGLQGMHSSEGMKPGLCMSSRATRQKPSKAICSRATAVACSKQLQRLHNFLTAPPLGNEYSNT